MLVLLLFLQVALPLALLAWLGFRPLGSRVGLTLQLAAVVLLVAVLGLSGIWLFPPFWMPVVYAALLAPAFFLGRRPAWAKLPAWPRDGGSWAATLVLLALVAFLLREAVGSLPARRQPPGPVAQLAFPLPPGRYLVVNGGSGLRLNAHVKTLDSTMARFRPWRGNSYGIDLVRLDCLGLRADGLLPRDPSRYHLFGVPVLAPCDGRVVTSVDGLPDQPVPEPDTMHRSGNHVILRCGTFEVVLAHFRRGSVIPAPGDSVEAGTVLARAGNSGASDEPHLHIHAQQPGTPALPMGGAPVPIRFGGRFLVRGDRVEVE